jgi:transketolase
MRQAFVQTLTGLAGHDSRILLLTGDLGYLALEPFADKFPSRFFNVGVAEQNMVGLATGLAEAGFIPFVYSIVPFAVLRPYEFIRNGPIQHQLPVRIVGVGGGLAYGPNGLSHYGLEDVAVMRVQPGLTVIAPADAPQTRTAVAGVLPARQGRQDHRAGVGWAFRAGEAATCQGGD